jgi:hypothetical protein
MIFPLMSLAPKCGTQIVHFPYRDANIGLDHVAPHGLRRWCGKLCRELELTTWQDKLLACSSAHLDAARTLPLNPVAGFIAQLLQCNENR